MNPYTEINYKGNAIGLYFGLTSLAAIYRDYDFREGLNEVHLNIGFFASVLSAGYENNCTLEKIKTAIKYKDFYLFIENELETNKEIPKDITEAMNTFMDSKLIKEASSNGVEKKMPV